ncbi:Splicing factor 3A subunit 1 [Phytophthora citrophthora]|uniref:Splicing factor 3A subunit 1 n=1 Tax=Phytophthora citrophthora TaxID=4793 RepID=A0AAD9G0P0_9STRA|nr:Splicing factor 3A subunit 1 [Phytophthora citrophthora]
MTTRVERRIVGERLSAKFSFLRESDPYHAYYEHKVSEFVAKKDESPSAAVPEQQGQEQTENHQQQEKTQEVVLLSVSPRVLDDAGLLRQLGFERVHFSNGVPGNILGAVEKYIGLSDCSHMAATKIQLSSELLRRGSVKQLQL